MTDHNISFQADFTMTPGFALTRDTTMSFGMNVEFGSQFILDRNALDFTVDTPGTLSLSVDTPGTLSL